MIDGLAGTHQFGTKDLATVTPKVAKKKVDVEVSRRIIMVQNNMPGFQAADKDWK